MSAPRVRRRPVRGGWALLVLFSCSACAPGASRGGVGPPARPRAASVAPEERSLPPAEPGRESATYALDFLEPGPVGTRPVPIGKAEFRQALRRLAHDVRRTGGVPREAAHALLKLSEPPPPEVETLEMEGLWLLESYREQTYSFVPLSQSGPVPLTPVADEALKAEYLKWCEGRGGGDCLSLLEDGPHLRTEDRRALALALSLGSVLDETRAALAHQLDEKALVSMVVWTLALYGLLWTVPEPTTKAVAATLTVILMGWLGLDTMWGLMDGWSRLAHVAHEASTFAELREAGEEFGKVLGEDAARAMILAVSTLAGRTLGEVAAKVRTLPGYRLAGAQWEAQGGAALLAPELAAETALAQQEALARAVAAVETVATSLQGPLAVVMLKKGPGRGAGQAPGGRSATTVIRHRGGNQQVELSDGQRWHLSRGKSLADIPLQDKVGDTLQAAVTKAAREWGPDKLSLDERVAIQKALGKGKYWLARLLEREARGRYVHEMVKSQFQRLYQFNHQGVDILDLSPGGFKYEILSGTESNLARHGRRMAGEFFRMLTF